MTKLDVEAIRALDFTRGTPDEVVMWREGDAEARANLAIEGMDLDADEHALFDMLREEAVPPPLATAIVLKLLDHPDADDHAGMTKMIYLPGAAGSATFWQPVAAELGQDGILLSWPGLGNEPASPARRWPGVWFWSSRLPACRSRI